MVNSPWQILDNPPENSQSRPVFIQSNSPTDNSTSSTPPTNPPRVNFQMANTSPSLGPRHFRNRFKPSPFDFSQIQGAPHDMPEKYFDKIPKFNGSFAIPVEEHIEAVWNYIEACGAEEEDVYMRALMSALEGDARGWFDRLPTRSIDGYDTFTQKLIEGWSAKPDNRFLLNQLFEVKKKENETIHEFNI